MKKKILKKTQRLMADLNQEKCQTYPVTLKPAISSFTGTILLNNRYTMKYFSAKGSKCINLCS